MAPAYKGFSPANLWAKFSAYILRREALWNNGSSPQGFQPILWFNFSRFKFYAKFSRFKLHA
jgi:hypothetical protein